MNSRGPTEEKPAGAGGAVRRKSGLPASEKGTGIIPEDESEQATDTRRPASEEDSGLIEREDEETVQSWPGSGGPGTIPPPG